MTWRVDYYDKQGNLICYRNLATQRKAERVALDVTRYAAVTTKVTEVQQHEVSLQY